MKENETSQELETASEMCEKRKLQKLYDANPFLQHLGITFERIEGGVRLDMKVSRETTNLYGLAHGAALFAMADTAMGWACHARGLRKVVTLDSSMNFIKAVPEGMRVYSLGKVIHAGRRTAVCEAGVYNEADELCLKAQGTFYVHDDEESKR